jgi:hypothetical protein
MFNSLSKIPKNDITLEQCLLAVKKDANEFNYVPDKFKVYEIYLYMVSHYNYHLHMVPDQFRTLEICKICIKDYPDNIAFIPYKHRTLEMCRNILEYNHSYQLIDHIPRNILTYDMCLESIKKNRFTFLFVL